MRRRANELPARNLLLRLLGVPLLIALLAVAAAAVPAEAACRGADCITLTVRATREIPTFSPFSLTTAKPISDIMFEHDAVHDIDANGCADLLGDVTDGVLHALTSDCRGTLAVRSYRGEFQHIARETMQFGDFNGDGELDIVGFDEPLQRSVILSRTKNSYFQRTGPRFPPEYRRLALVRVLDVDGDRYDDLVAFLGNDTKTLPYLTQTWALLRNARGVHFELVEPYCFLREEHATVGRGVRDFSGEEILFSAALGQRDFAITRLYDKKPCQTYVWSDFPNNSAERLLMADITGDGLSDVISISNRQEWWFARGSDADYGIESALTSFIPEGSRIEKVVPIDLNGDGASDLLFRADGALRAAIAEPGEPIPDAQISGCGEELGTTDENGMLSAELTPSCRSIDVMREGFRRRTVAINPQGTAQTVLLSSVIERERTGVLSTHLSGEHRPQVCSGYRTTSLVPDGKWGRSSSACPGFYVAIGIDDRPNETALMQIDCCPLPAVDIFEEARHPIEDSRCPDGYVVIGVNLDPASLQFARREDLQKAILCKKINSARYQLGPVTRGRYWGVGRSMRRESTPLRYESLPAGVRHGIGRLTFSTWDVDGCVGDPVGSLLVGVSPGGCEQQHFRELQFKGQSGDPPAGTAVPLFSECSSVEGTYTPHARCAGSTEGETR